MKARHIELTREKIRFQELRPDLWPAFERLFGPNGACGGCWCMWWRIELDKQWRQLQGARNKKAMRNLVHSGKAFGILAFVEDEPVGWCSFGPRRDFPRLIRVKAYKRDDADDVWSVVCFFVHRRWRGKGLSRELLKAAVDALRKRGVKTVEAYPVTTTKDGRRVSSTFAYTGPVGIFEELGFRTVQSTNSLKPLMRLEL
ncbi:MAG TPA: GNAT family N-acetyltransferase [Candidatus Bathyarchaeia archaeon]|nr:GNAT family N-acetyltransferase [Candidatus Bathyarchaeia archaeon]